MRSVDRNFDPQRFLQGAEAAFRMIVGAFAAGDRVQLRTLLADDTYRSFEPAIAAREAAGETQRSEIRSIEQRQHRGGHAERHASPTSPSASCPTRSRKRWGATGVRWRAPMR